MSFAPKQQEVGVISYKQYSCIQNIFCCRCLSCCKKKTIMTSDIRKETIQRMMKTYLVEDNEKILYDPIKLMILIYVCDDDSIPNKYIERCKLNPSVGVSNYRTDLQFYIPQICNYLVFHRNLENNYLRQAIQKMTKLNFYFAHLYYFYMRGIQRNITKIQIQVFEPVIQYNYKLLNILQQEFQDISLTCMDIYIQKENIPKREDQFVRKVIMDYESTKLQYGKFTKVQPQDVFLKKYCSIFQDQRKQVSSFQSTIIFFDDLFCIVQDLKDLKDNQQKKQRVTEHIKMINQNLPATVYVPFSKNSYRLCNILKVVTSEIVVFKTKERSPVCLCVQIFCPAEQLDDKKAEIFWTNVQIPITLKMTSFSKRSEYFSRHFQKTAQFKSQRQTSNIKQLSVLTKNIMEEEKLKQFYSNNLDSAKNIPHRKSRRPSFDPGRNINLIKNSDSQKQKNIVQLNCYNQTTKKKYDQSFAKMFGMSLVQLRKNISNNSIFGNFKTWDILYIIIKTNDDLKQEQFAMQLIHQFDYIFKLQNIPLILTSYEVLSMGPDRGIIQMVKDSVTLDNLKKTLKTQFSSVLTLRDFFQIYFCDDIVSAKQNFMKSLAAYSLVMYIIQVKDRHNGNILLHRNGKIFHIDFGFFLSSMPGRGLQIQKNCPFKFLSEYIEVLDGVQSWYFKKFRQYFFLGFKAIRKHQNKILMLVKMMYSSGGLTMPCFQKGQQAIKCLQDRINPPGIINDLLLNQHCQNLINLSIDNWAAKWYDRFQYWAQGIFY